MDFTIFGFRELENLGHLAVNTTRNQQHHIFHIEFHIKYFLLQSAYQVKHQGSGDFPGLIDFATRL